MKKNLFQKFLQNKLLIVFIFGLIITLPTLIPSYNVDGYCTYANGYLYAAKIFMKAGRIFTAFIFYFNNLIKLPMPIFSTISAILSNLFLALSINKLYKYFKKYIKINNKFSDYLLLLGVFLIFYNPFNLELFIFEESFVMIAGIYFMVCGAIKFMNKSLKSYLISFLLVLLGTICYQGIVCYFIPILFLLVALELKGNLKEDYKNILLKGLIAICIYGISLIISYGIVKIVNIFIFTEVNPKLGTIDLILNIKSFFILMYSSLKSLCGYGSRIIFYLSILAIILIIILNYVKKEKNYWIKVFYMFFNIFLCVIMAFVPNLAMSSTSNYTAARMIGSIGTIVGILIIYCILYFNILTKKTLKYSLIIIALGYFVYISIISFFTTYTALNTYKEDMNIVGLVKEKIVEYEKLNDIKITKIFYAKDSSVSWLYNSYVPNSSNYRVYAVYWAVGCVFNMDEITHYEVEMMNNEDKELYFSNKNYSSFNDEQLVFKDDTLYLLLY